MAFPSRPLHLVIGASRGSASHIIACAVAPFLSDTLQQEVKVEILPGDNGLVAARHVRESEADGHTMLVSTFGMHVMASPAPAASDFDINTSLRPISLLARCPLLLAVHSSVDAQDLEALGRIVRRGPGRLDYASSAIGGAPHLATELYCDMIEAEMNHVVYRETEQLFVDLVAGKVALSFNNIMTLSGLVADGKLRGIAVTSAKRASIIPGIPTFEESGLAGYEVTNWLGILGPKPMDASTVDSLNEAIAETIQDGALQSQLAALGVELGGSSAEQFSLFVEGERARWKPIVEKIKQQKING